MCVYFRVGINTCGTDHTFLQLWCPSIDWLSILPTLIKWLLPWTSLSLTFPSVVCYPFAWSWPLCFEPQMIRYWTWAAQNRCHNFTPTRDQNWSADAAFDFCNNSKPQEAVQGWLLWKCNWLKIQVILLKNVTLTYIGKSRNIQKGILQC